jgi:hypothetical protein
MPHLGNSLCNHRPLPSLASGAPDLPGDRDAQELFRHLIGRQHASKHLRADLQIDGAGQAQNT